MKNLSPDTLLDAVVKSNINFVVVLDGSFICPSSLPLFNGTNIVHAEKTSPANISDLSAAGQFAKVPALLGTNANEGRVFSLSDVAIFNTTSSLLTNGYSDAFTKVRFLHVLYTHFDEALVWESRRTSHVSVSRLLRIVWRQVYRTSIPLSIRRCAFLPLSLHFYGLTGIYI